MDNVELLVVKQAEKLLGMLILESYDTLDYTDQRDYDHKELITKLAYYIDSFTIHGEE